MNETVTSYIQGKKADEAARFLLFTNKSHIDISCLLNFGSQSNFIQIFKKYKHMTPKQYQDSQNISIFTLLYSCCINQPLKKHHFHIQISIYSNYKIFLF